MTEKLQQLRDLTVPWTFVLLLIIGILGFLFIRGMDHESRLSRVETVVESVATIKSDVGTIKTAIDTHLSAEAARQRLLEEIRNDQKRREKLGK